MKSSNKNKLLLSSFVAVFVLLLGGLGVNATIDCNLTTPSSSVTTVGSLTNITASYNASDGSWDKIFVAFEAKSTETVNSSYSLIANVSNISNLKFTNFTIKDNVILLEGCSYTWRATCTGTTGGAANGGSSNTTTSSEVTSVCVDRGHTPKINGLTVLQNSSLTSKAASICFGLINTTRYEFRETGNLPVVITITSSLTNTSKCHTVTPRDNSGYFVRAFDGINTTNSVTASYTLQGDLIVGITLQGVPQQITEQRLQLITEKLSGKTKALIIIIGGSITFGLLLVIIMASNKNKRRKRR